ncbi:MAG: phenylacetate--CoA ligase family protein, partial [Gammaproteobacteria bacterium]|nr:phenylacetate--CoA ligase family protein [Gammaproteobacteria bacterium]
MGEHFDDLEVREPAERERALFEALPRQLANARSNAPGFAPTLADVEPDSITDRTGLARLPLVRKADLVTLQPRRPPFGGLTATPLAELARVFASPGPIFEPEARRSDYWRMARALHAAGLRRGQLVHNSFSYHLTPAGAMMESGAQALGCAVF